MKQNQLKMVAAQGAEAVMVFENPEFGKIRIIAGNDGEPLFCGKDVCDTLGYRRTDHAVHQLVNSSDVLKRYVAKTVKNRYGLCEGKVQKMQMLFVTESGFYALVLGSKLDSAQRFKLWVTSVVLPQIRKTGGYIPIVPGETEEETRKRAERILHDTLHQKNVLIAQQKKLLGEQVARIEQLNHQVDEQVARIAKTQEQVLSLEHYVDELVPKAIYSDNVLDSISCFTTTQIAKELGITAQELNRSLCAAHIQYYQSGQYLLYADFAHMGLAKSRTKTENVMCQVTEDGFKQGHVYTHTYLVWTERGRKFIHQLVKRYWDLSKAFCCQNR